jgi:hypothetical protein
VVGAEVVDELGAGGAAVCERVLAGVDWVPPEQPAAIITAAANRIVKTMSASLNITFDPLFILSPTFLNYTDFQEKHRSPGCG